MGAPQIPLLSLAEAVRLYRGQVVAADTAARLEAVGMAVRLTCRVFGGLAHARMSAAAAIDFSLGFPSDPFNRYPLSSPRMCSFSACADRVPGSSAKSVRRTREFGPTAHTAWDSGSPGWVEADRRPGSRSGCLMLAPECARNLRARNNGTLAALHNFSPSKCGVAVWSF